MRNGTRPERITILGLTFKENIPDIRNSKVVDIVRELKSFGVIVQVNDPLADHEDAVREYGIELVPDSELVPSDGVILAVAHDSYVAGGWPLIHPLLKNGRGVFVDVKAKFDRATKPDGIMLWRL